MAIIKPFKGIRPVPQLANKVAALPYDVMDSQEARLLVKDNPYSFLHVDKAEIDLDPSINPYDQKVYEKARDNLQAMIRSGTLIQDQENHFYIYELVMNGRSQVGLVVCTSIDDYLNQVIKKHEHTRPSKEEDRINHVDYCNANTGPIFLTYHGKQEVNDLVNQCMKHQEPVYDIEFDDEVRHRVWIIDSVEVMEQLKNAFAQVDTLYIADGHHRCASAVKVGLKRRASSKDYTGNEEFNFFLSVLFPHDQLHIMDYNRVIKDLNGNTSAEFLQKIEDKFIIEIPREQGPFSPQEKKNFGMYLDDTWYSIKAKEGTYPDKDPVASLDISILQDNLLHPILGIEDPRTDERIDFVGGIRGLEELERRVQEDMKVAFSMFPTTIEDLMSVADSGQMMPPKSTWFEPKLRSGFFIHELS
ncbi:DUF1015 family protein [Dehalobacterium formicoaceticum]|uniref:DUF1015 family protein n=1 Tax=Dehalobacterium formicoaceticum TaxID=51515 RepID=A0ABT1Y8P2_9FIRM|nr:DUF1015 family protein [Dehalobacterium formicoaceticum]MCR6546856.1 DUF1015 family protein [Dehalobacterium formicoaceticum]